MKINAYTFETPKVSRDCVFAVLSDIHARPYEEAIMLTSSIKPDAILVAGDIVDRHYRIFSLALPFLTACSEIAPTFFSYGNHEIKYPVLSPEEIKQTGVTLLDNSFTTFGDITIGGQRPYSDTGWLGEFEKQEGFLLLMDHHPEHYPEYLKDGHKGIDLILSGHAHGGQIRIKNRGLFSPGQGILPKYTKGFYDNRLLVSAGLSNTGSPIPRICNEPEVLKLTIKKQV